MRHTNLHAGVSPMPEPAANVGGYLPIAEHGLIGDLHTVALVGTEGTIDWYCCPRFDAPSLFGALLDRERGGYWRLAPTDTAWTTKQLYFPDTVTDAVYRKAPYASQPNRDVRNADDSIYRNGGKRSQVSVKKNGAGVYVASIVMGVHRS